MKGWLKLLVLGVIPILAVTTVAAQTTNDKGSQLIFQSNMAHKNFISVVNAHPMGHAVTLLTQYYNDEMEQVVWYLRVVPGGGNVLVDPFNHMIPTTETNVGDFIMESGKDNSGHFVIAITPVGTIAADAGTVVDSLYPEFLVGDMHDPDSNIDNCGGDTFAAAYSPTTATDEEDCEDGDTTTKNVSDWGVDEALPIAFNHLTGHFTEALLSTDAGGGDQTASWGGTPTVRTAMNADAMAADYLRLTGENAARLAEKGAGGTEATVSTTTGTGYTADGGNTITDNDARTNRVLNGGALVLPALHGGGDETKQIMLILSAADSFGDPGEYALIPATTGITVTLMDNMGNALPDPQAEMGPVFGGAEDPEMPAGINVIVEGVRVRTDADLTDCSTGTMIDGPWTLGHLTSIVPSASSGTDDFAGLDAMLDPMMNATPGWIKFARADTMVCKMDYGDGDGATSSVEDNDGVPTTDERSYTGGTQVVEADGSTQARNFVTVGRALLKFVTADSTFAASWTLKSPPN